MSAKLTIRSTLSTMFYLNAFELMTSWIAINTIKGSACCIECIIHFKNSQPSSVALKYLTFYIIRLILAFPILTDKYLLSLMENSYLCMMMKACCVTSII